MSEKRGGGGGGERGLNDGLPPERSHCGSWRGPDETRTTRGREGVAWFASFTLLVWETGTWSAAWGRRAREETWWRRSRRHFRRLRGPAPVLGTPYRHNVVTDKGGSQE